MKVIVPSLLMILTLFSCNQSTTVDLFIGTYTQPGKSEGVYVYSFDEATGDFSFKTAVRAENPSFISLNHKANVLYAVNETDEGAVSSFSYVNGNLRLLNTLPSAGSSPCYIITDKKDEFVFVANYGGGNLTVFKTNKDGSLKEMVQNIQNEGTGPNQDRQTAPFVHSAVFSPDEKFLLVQDLGTDRITVYPFTPDNPAEPLQVSKAIIIHTPAGSGPRHITFSENGEHVYVAAELTSTVQVYSFNNGHMKLIQEIDMLSEKVGNPVGAADIHLSADGRFLYSSNRGNSNEINIYQVDDKTGKLENVDRQSTLGIAPRNFTISPSGKFLLVANQGSDEIVIFNRDEKSGQLTDTGKRIQVGSPVCLVFN